MDGSGRITGKRVATAWPVLVVASCLAALAACASEEAAKRGRAYFNEGMASLEQDQQAAFVSLQKAVQADPKLKDAHYYIGHIYVLKEKYPEAEEQFRKVLSLDPDYSEAHNYLGQVLEAQGRWKEAIASYRRALNNPTYATPDIAWFKLGRALRHEGDLKQALLALEDAQTISPLSVPPVLMQLELGRTYQQLGYVAKAREALTKAADLDKTGPEGAEARQLLGQLKP
jgi:Tfp pilus assembly protein PilF